MHWLGGVFSDQRYGIHQMVAEGDLVAVRLVHSGRHTGEFLGMAPTGRRFAYRHMHLIRFVDGLMIEHWAVRDDLSSCVSSGVSSPHPSRWRRSRPDRVNPPETPS